MLLGTYVRTTAIDDLVERFLDSNPSQKKQIISLGAGSDTRFFRLSNRRSGNGGNSHDHPGLVYHEVDFSENNVKKVAAIAKSKELSGHIHPAPVYSNSIDATNPSLQYDTLNAENYHVHSIDLRNLDSSKAPLHFFEHINPELPTLLISECCLVYLAPDAADSVVKYFSQYLFPQSTPLGLIIYEPINPHDAFGKVMVSNLAARGIVLQTLRKYGSLEAQAARMKAYGFEGSMGADVNTLWEKGVDEAEKERVAGLEMVDEVEEWKLLAGHYCVFGGWRGEGWKGWEQFAEQISKRGG